MSSGRSGLRNFLLGGFVGAIFGLLFAPKPGKELREELKVKTGELVEQCKELCSPERLGEALEAGRKAALEKSEELREKIEETKEKVKKQVDRVTELAQKRAGSKTKEE